MCAAQTKYSYRVRAATLAAAFIASCAIGSTEKSAQSRPYLWAVLALSLFFGACTLGYESVPARAKRPNGLVSYSVRRAMRCLGCYCGFVCNALAEAIGTALAGIIWIVVFSVIVYACSLFLSSSVASDECLPVKAGKASHSLQEFFIRNETGR